MIDYNKYNVLVLIRCFKTDTGVYGKLFVNDVFQCYTLENRLTLFPKGIYDLDLNRVSPRFRFRSPYCRYKGIVPCIKVPKRDGILIHVGNWPSDSSGCVLVGDKWTRGRDRIFESTSAYVNLYEKLSKYSHPCKFVVFDVYDL